MGKPDARRACAAATACLCAILAAHFVLGGISLLLPIPHALAPLIWAGAALLVAHVGVCVVTSRQMMTDKMRPPSSKKKRHLALKWATGALVAAVAIAHVAGRAVLENDPAAPASLALSAALAALVGWHACVGAKSFLKDLGLDYRYRGAFRAAACAIAAFAVAAAAICGLPR